MKDREDGYQEGKAWQKKEKVVGVGLAEAWLPPGADIATAALRARGVALPNAVELCGPVPSEELEKALRLPCKPWTDVLPGLLKGAADLGDEVPPDSRHPLQASALECGKKRMLGVYKS